MVLWNNNTVTEFILIGFPSLYSYGPLLFVCLLIVYLLTIAGNVTICILVKVESHLHSPMYIFISILSLIEIFYTAVTIPKMLVSLITEKRSISVRGCLLQTYFFHSLGSCEGYLLTVMSYDRYLAICHPLHYSSIMTLNMIAKLVGTCFTLGFLCPITEVVLISRLPFCDNNNIEHIFCDFPPLLNLACVDTSVNVLADFITNCFIILVNFSLLMISYGRIIIAIVKIKTSVGRTKAFSTCVSHLTVVLIFFTCIVFMYVRLTKSYSLYFDRSLAVIYSVVTPILNPIIYSFRNKKIRLAFKNRMCQWDNFPS